MIDFSLEKLISAKLEARPSNDEGQLIASTLVCGESKISIFGMTFYVSIIEMFLNLNANEGHFPFDNWLNHNAPRELGVDIESNGIISGGTSSELRAGVSLTNTPSVDFGISSNSNRSRSASNKISYSMKAERFIPRGSESSPSWKVKILPGEYLLQGMIMANEILCKYYGKNIEKMSMSVEIPNYGIVIKRDKWNRDAHSNKRSIIAILLSKYVRNNLEDQKIEMSVEND
jgi:hypothetical protein